VQSKLAGALVMTGSFATSGTCMTWLPQVQAWLKDCNSSGFAVKVCLLNGSDSLHDPAMKSVGNSQMRKHQIVLVPTALHGDQGTWHGDQGILPGDHGTLHAQPCGIC